MKNRTISLVLAGVVGIAVLAGCSGPGASSSSTTSQSPSAAASNMPSVLETSGPSTGAATVLPVDKNPIVNTSAAPGLSITYAAVEDNVDPDTKAPIPDRLELTLKNETYSPLNHVEVYYTMTDTKTKAVENYYADLSHLSLPAGKETTIYFDNTGEVGHYPENKFSLYRSSVNEVTFSIEASADGVKPAQATAVKAVGTGEVPGE